jgi:hypothetical protein
MNKNKFKMIEIIWRYNNQKTENNRINVLRTPQLEVTSNY